MATEAHETGAAFAAAAAPELTKTTRVGNERTRNLEDRARREHQKNLPDARSEWQKKANGKLKNDEIWGAVDGNLGFGADRKDGVREPTGDANLDRRIKTTEDLLSVAQKIAELRDFSDFGTEVTRLGLEDAILAQYDRIPQLKPIADLIYGRNGATRIPDSEKTKLIQHLLDKQPDFAHHMIARLKPLLEATVPDYGLKAIKDKEDTLNKDQSKLADEEIRINARNGVAMPGSTDLAMTPSQHVDIANAEEFMKKRMDDNPVLYKDIDKYITLRNTRAYFEAKIAASANPVEVADLQRKIVSTEAEFRALSAKPDLVDALGTPVPGSEAENVKNYLISKDTIDRTAGTDRKAVITKERAANVQKLTDLATERSTKQPQRDRDEVEYVTKIRDAIAGSAFDTIVDRMDNNIASIAEDMKKTARNEMGQALNDELTKKGFFGETADRKQIRDYFDTLVMNGEAAAISGLGLPEELRQEITDNPALRAEFNSAILYNAMKYNGLRREDLNKIVNFDWGEAAIEAAIAKNAKLDEWEKKMDKAGLMAGGMVEWLRKHPNKNLVAAILAALLSGVGAAAVVGLASLPAAGLAAGAAAAVGGMAGGIGMNNLSEAA